MRIALAILFLAAPLASADAQKRCVKGIPCGNTCISASKTCRIGSPSTPARTTTSSTQPQPLFGAPPAGNAERAQYVFMVREIPGGTPYIVFVPLYAPLSVLAHGDGELRLELPRGTSLATANELARQLTRQVEVVSYGRTP
jgi:hypothetical protein